MFEENFKHDRSLLKGIERQVYVEWKKRGMSYIDVYRLGKKCGRPLGPRTHKLDRKRRACYPRGKATIRMFLLEGT